MIRIFLLIVITLVFILFIKKNGFSQDSVISDINPMINKVSSMLISDRKLNIGGYGQIDYNQPFGNGTIQNGKLDVHRLVLLFGYRFTNKLSFITEIEIEHVKEVYVEQAFVNYAFNTYVNFRGGLLLIPMGIINEYHEPPTFNGVERPLIDKYIAPTTWREIGLGITGTIPEISIRYQLYVVNGFKSYQDGNVFLNGKNGLRKGRQKGAESFFNFPNFSVRVEYYGILGLNIGLSGYYGKTQSTMYNSVNRNNQTALNTADSTVVGIAMVGFDVRYHRKGFGFRGQIYFTSLSNTQQYNYFAQDDDVPNDLGSSMYGYYIEAAYNVFYPFKKIRNELISFVRLSHYDTQASVADGIDKNDAYSVKAFTAGIGFWFLPQVALKTDVQFIKSKADNNYNKLFNAGIAIMF